MIATCSDEAGIDWIFEQLRKKFKDVTTTRGSKHSFLGQTFEFSVEGECSVTLEGFTPALEDLFIVDEIFELLSDELSAIFHNMSAKAYYLALRMRPDILTAAAFLVTRVKGPTVQDEAKLDRMLA